MIIQKVYDPHRDHGYKCIGEICTTLDAHMGTGGNNVPMVLKVEIENDGEDIQREEIL